MYMYNMMYIQVAIDNAHTRHVHSGCLVVSAEPTLQLMCSNHSNTIEAHDHYRQYRVNIKMCWKLYIQVHVYAHKTYLPGQNAACITLGLEFMEVLSKQCTITVHRHNSIVQ